MRRTFSSLPHSMPGTLSAGVGILWKDKLQNVRSTRHGQLNRMPEKDKLVLWKLLTPHQDSISGDILDGKKPSRLAIKQVTVDLTEM